jgi:hypothetical protein
MLENEVKAILPHLSNKIIISIIEKAIEVVATNNILVTLIQILRCMPFDSSVLVPVIRRVENKLSHEKSIDQMSHILCSSCNSYFLQGEMINLKQQIKYSKHVVTY